MPHVIVKVFAGKTDAQKQAVTTKITEALMTSLGSSEASISVAIEEVDPKDWKSKVYEPDIVAKAATITKQPANVPK